MEYDQINQLYLDYLGRPASADELKFYAKRFGTDVDRNETLKFIEGAVKSGEITRERADELKTPLVINYQTVDFMAGQLADQYAKQKEAGYSYKNEEDLPKFFRAQAAKLAANGVTSIYDVQQADGGIVNAATGEAIKDVVLRPTWETDPEAYKFRGPVELEERGKFTRWGKDLSVDGQADYGISFENGVPVYTPFWKDTATKIFGMNLEDAVKTAIALTAAYYGGSYLMGGEAAAGAGAGTTAATSTAVPGSFQAALPSLGVNTAATTAASTAVPGTFSAALPGLLAPTAAGAPIYFAEAVPANELAYPAREVAANYTPVPGSFQEALPGLGVETAASAAPFTAAPGSFQAAIPSLLSTAAAGGLGLTDALRAANSINNLLNPQTIQQQAGLPQAQAVGGGQARGVDFSPLYRNTIVGLLPGAERYRRSLI